MLTANYPYTTLRLGSTGAQVSALQSLLNQNGASLPVDGVFGETTQSALKQYQSQKGLDADGVAGDNTWAVLTAPSYSSAAASPYAGLSGVSEHAASQLYALEKGFQPSGETQALKDALDALLQSAPGEFSSPYQAQLDALSQTIASRSPFAYTPSADPLFQSYQDMYQTNARLSMMDAFGQASALTGGYANSYAQTLSQQSYDRTLQSLYDRIPDFYSMALSAYETEGDRLAGLYDNLHSLYQNDYTRYQDDYSRYLARLSRQQSLYENQLQSDFNSYSALLSYWQDVARLQNTDYWKRQENAVTPIFTGGYVSSSAADPYILPDYLTDLLPAAPVSSSSGSSKKSKSDKNSKSIKSSKSAKGAK